jgi:branched-subunit amino acid aminotransferase/4-amino-4-deoxychorismate lyase
VEREITLDELLEAEEVWFSSSGKVLRLVTNLNGIDLHTDFEGSLYRKACNIFLEEIKNY